MRSALLDRAHAAVELATKAGASGVFAHASNSKSTSCEIRDGKLETMKESNSRSLSLRLYVDGRYFAHSTSDLRQEQLQSFVKEAVAMTRHLQPDPHRTLPDPSRFATGSPNLDAYDDGVGRISPDQRIESCQAVNERMAGKTGVISASSSAYDGHYKVAAASSNGFSGEYGATFVGMYGSATMRDKGDKRPEGGMGYNTRHIADLPGAKAIGDEALERARERVGATKGPTMRAPMVVDRRIAGRLLFSLLGPAWGRAVQQGNSFWVGKLGKKVLPEALELHDEPLIPRAVGSQPFDGEGIAARRMPIITGGALRNYFLDTYYANKLGMKPTTAGMSNWVLTPGKRDLDAIVGDIKKGIYVTSWLGGNSDGTSGEFSFGIRGFLIENGKLGAPVSEMNVTGDIVELFGQLREVGSDPWVYSSLRSPTLAFDKVEFSGA